MVISRLEIMPDYRPPSPRRREEGPYDQTDDINVIDDYDMNWEAEDRGDESCGKLDLKGGMVLQF